MSPRLSAIDFTPDLEKLTKDFTGRQWVFDDIDLLLKEPEEQFFVLTRELGMEKSLIRYLYLLTVPPTTVNPEFPDTDLGIIREYNNLAGS